MYPHPHNACLAFVIGGQHLPRTLPDPHVRLREASDFILTSPLGRRAQGCRLPRLSIFVRDLLEGIYRLTESCHLPEFTDHGLPHLSSLIDRISEWTIPDSRAVTVLVDVLEENEAAILLLATLMHDVGMLSQKSEDLDPQKPHWKVKGGMDVATWVRETHVNRLQRLLRRLLIGQDQSYGEILGDEIFLSSVRVAEAHTLWPWEPGFQNLGARLPGLAAVLSVADLMDEDCNRCDTSTLLNHRHGTLLNVAHWIRHSLTSERVLIRGGRIHVRILRPPATDLQIAPAFCALRNHFRLALLYTPQLGLLGAGLLGLVFDPPTDCPEAQADSLAGWNTVPGLSSQRSLLYNLLSSFMPLALLDETRVPPEVLNRARSYSFEPVDLTDFRTIRGRVEIRSPDEQIFLSNF
ncbi:MAG: hypothetical protein GHCLOJNM_03309 [bacterium]|nr:hypothetical protein [bacterium]